MKNTVVYLLPGWTYNSNRWEGLVKMLKNENIETHKLKIPGLEEKINIPWNISDYINWLDEKLKNETKKIVLIGHSNGGRIALSYIIARPEKISHLILIDSAGILENNIKYKIKIALFKLIAKTGKFLRFPSSTRSLLYKVAREKDYYNSNPILKKTMQNLIAIDLKENLDIIKIPTVIIWGQDDKITPLKSAYTFNSLLKNSNLFIIKNAKHSPQYTHPEKVFEIIKDSIS